LTATPRTGDEVEEWTRRTRGRERGRPLVSSCREKRALLLEASCPRVSSFPSVEKLWNDAQYHLPESQEIGHMTHPIPLAHPTSQDGLWWPLRLGPAADGEEETAAAAPAPPAQPAPAPAAQQQQLAEVVLMMSQQWAGGRSSGTLLHWSKAPLVDELPSVEKLWDDAKYHLPEPPEIGYVTHPITYPRPTSQDGLWWPLRLGPADGETAPAQLAYVMSQWTCGSSGPLLHLSKTPLVDDLLATSCHAGHRSDRSGALQS